MPSHFLDMSVKFTKLRHVSIIFFHCSFRVFFTASLFNFHESSKDKPETTVKKNDGDMSQFCKFYRHVEEMAWHVLISMIDKTSFWQHLFWSFVIKICQIIHIKESLKICHGQKGDMSTFLETNLGIWKYEA
jgi:hypothetical protein